MRLAYLYAGISMAVAVLFNAPRAFWIALGDSNTPLLFRGFSHGMIGFSYLVSWALLVSAVYCTILGILYWDMDTREHVRGQFTLETLGTARLLWGLAIVCAILGLLYMQFVLRADDTLWPAGFASSLGALICCWLFWLAFPLYEQVGLDREG